MMRLLSAVAWCLFLLLGGCAEETDMFVGTFSAFLRDAELEDMVRLDKRDSVLDLRFFRGETGNLCGEMIFDGDVQIMGFDVFDFGYDPYPIAELNLDLDRASVKGRVAVPNYPMKVHFKGDFTNDFQILDVEVNLLGALMLERIEHKKNDSKNDEDRPKECR